MECAEMRAKLGAMLDEYDGLRRSEAAHKQQARDEEAAFLEGFARLRRDVVRPVFEAAGELLHARGHGFAIREQEFAAPAGGKTTEALIELSVSPAGMEGAASADRHLQELSFSTRHYNRTVSITNGAVPQSGSIAGSQGAHALARIDAALVEGEVLKLMAALVRR
jgi:hypothetical protein